MIYKGRVVSIGDIIEKGEKKFKTREVVLEEVTDREKKGGLVFSLLGDKVDIADSFSAGDLVDAHLNIRTSEYNGRTYNNISAWRVDKISGAKEEQDDSLPF